MARLIPRINVEEISLKPERDVATALINQLPDNCIVYHSYPWIKPVRNDRKSNIILQEGEVDFVIVIPELGFLILEIKGGVIDYDSNNHLWYRELPNGGRREIKDPFEQARRNNHYLEKEILKQSFPYQDRVPCAFGYAVVFPGCEYSGIMPPGAEDSIILTSKDLPFMDRRIPETLRKWTRLRNPKPLTKQELDGIVKGLSPSFNLLPVLFRKIEEQEERLFRLTEDQIRVLDFIQKHNRAAIEGVAGSGKTMLAQAQAQRFADQGLKTLLLCYNKTLSSWLASSMPKEYADRIFVHHFHSLCIKYCKENGQELNWNDSNKDDFWKYDAPDKFINAIELTGEKFDAIVVDEGQDFVPEWWIPIEMLLKEENGPIFLFYDPAQNLYVGDDLTIPNLGTPITLPTNCRNTMKIAETCSRVSGINIPVRKDAPSGDDTVIQVVSRSDAQAKTCQKIINKWIVQGKLKPSQIAILCPNTYKKSSLSAVDKIQNIPITENINKWEKDEGTLFSTIRNFKGLEADAVVLIDVPKPGSLPYFGKNDLYVACSRAKHLLTVLPNAEGIIQ